MRYHDNVELQSFFLSFASWLPIIKSSQEGNLFDLVGLCRTHPVLHFAEILDIAFPNFPLIRIPSTRRAKRPFYFLFSRKNSLHNELRKSYLSIRIREKEIKTRGKHCLLSSSSRSIMWATFYQFGCFHISNSLMFVLIIT